MRMPFRSTLLLASFVFANSAFGNADPITVIVTTVGTGTFNSQPFTNRLVTFTSSFTTESLDSCEGALYDCIQADSNGALLLSTSNPFDQPIAFTVNVAGFGTFDTAFDYFLDVSQGQFGIGESEDRLGLYVTHGPPGNYDLRHSIGPFSGPSLTPDEIGDCEFAPCPPNAVTNGGTLILTSAADTATGEIQVGSPSPIPEPGTLILLGTGLLGVAGAIRPKLFNS